MTVTVDQLREVALFSELDDETLDQDRRSRAARSSGAPGQTVIKEEDRKGEVFHLILPATADVSAHGTPVAKAGPGEYFGELSLLDGKPRSAQVDGRDRPVDVLDRVLALRAAHGRAARRCGARWSWRSATGSGRSPKRCRCSEPSGGAGGLVEDDRRGPAAPSPSPGSRARPPPAPGARRPASAWAVRITTGTPGSVVVDPLHRADAVQVGHRQVHHDRVGLQARGLVAGLPPAAGLPGDLDVGLHGQRRGQRGTERRVVVHDQHAHGSTSLCRGSYIWCTADRVSSRRVSARGIFVLVLPCHRAVDRRWAQAACGEPSERLLVWVRRADRRFLAYRGPRVYSAPGGAGAGSRSAPERLTYLRGRTWSTDPRGTTRHGLRPGG